MPKKFHVLFRPKTKYWCKKRQFLYRRRRQAESVFYTFFGMSTLNWPPTPTIHMRPPKPNYSLPHTLPPPDPDTLVTPACRHNKWMAPKLCFHLSKKLFTEIQVGCSLSYCSFIPWLVIWYGCWQASWTCEPQSRLRIWRALGTTITLNVTLFPPQSLSLRHTPNRRLRFTWRDKINRQ